jgi:hypothetical protein
VFSTRSVPMSYLEDNCGDQVSWKSACEGKSSVVSSEFKYCKGGWGEVAL